MGTNYYLIQKPPCPCCNRPYEELHIGKSSMGWCFALQIYPNLGINDLGDWVKLWDDPQAIIKDEYDREVSPKDLLETITNRDGSFTERWSNRDFERNYSEPGPRGLARCKVDGSHCVKHGDGTWDCIVGEFS